MSAAWDWAIMDDRCATCGHKRKYHDPEVAHLYNCIWVEDNGWCMCREFVESKSADPDDYRSVGEGRIQ